MKELEFVKPGDIEKRSFAIIAEELAMRHITIKEEEAPITMRVIHTSADFEYADTMTYSENAIETARTLLQNGADIVMDGHKYGKGGNQQKGAGRSWWSGTLFHGG